MNMDGKTIVSTVIAIAVTGLLIGFVGATTFGALDDMVNDAETYSEITVSEYNDQFELSYNSTYNDTQNTNDTYDLRDIRHNNGSASVTSYYQLEDEFDPKEKTSLYVDSTSGATTIKNSSATFLYDDSGDGDELVNISYEFTTSNWSRTNYSGNYTYTVNVDSWQNVTTNHTYEQSTIDVLTVIPIITAVGIIIALLIVALKVY